MAMQCDVRSVLLSDYNTNLQQYREAIERLKRDGVPLLESEYLLLWKSAYRAMNACKESQRRLGGHMLEHRCLFDSEVPPTATSV
jgi:hypothetical protein